MPRGRRSAASACAVALLLVLPARAAAQKDAFIDAFITFHSALPGTYGDEGPAVVASLDRMTAALDEWERAGRAAEAQLKARAASTSVLPGLLALHHLEQYRLDDALVAIDTAIAGDPQRGSLHVFRGLLLEATGRPAGGAFDTARRLDPADPIAAYLAAARMTVADGGDSLAPLVNTLQAAVDRGAQYRTRPFYAFALVDDLSAKTPIFSPAAYANGFASMTAGRFRQAIAEFRAAAARDPLVADPAGTAERVRLGIASLRDRRGAPAIEHLEAAMAAFPDSPEAHRVLGVAYRAAGRVKDAIPQFEAAVRMAPDDERARVALGTALVEAGRVDDAVRSLRDTIARLPASGSARWALAEIYDRGAKAPEAVAILEEAAALTVVAGKAQLYWRIAEVAHGYQRDAVRVIDVLSRRARLVPNEPHAHKDLGLAYARAGRDDEALVELLMARLLGHEDAEMLTAIGQIHVNAARFAAAETPLRRAVALDPSVAQTRYALGTALLRLGRQDEAKEQLAAFQRLQQAEFDAQRRKFENDQK